MIASAEEFVALRESTDPQEYLRAATEEAPLSVWQEVIQRFPEMKLWAAQNKTIPEEVLRLLSADQDVGVRSMVAIKNKLPEDLRALLADDQEESVRERIVYNKSTSEALLKQLANDRVERISLAARARLLR